MKNFIIFVIFALVMGFGGYLLYSKYVLHKDPGEAIGDLAQDDQGPTHYELAEKARREGDTATALKEYKLALEAHDSKAQRLPEEDQRESVLARIAEMAHRHWEEEGKDDEPLRIDAIRWANRYLEEYPEGSRRRGVSRNLADLNSAS
jgi:hypothetical protein